MLDLDGTPGAGGIQQTFATIADQKYQVTFDMAGDPQGAPSVKRLMIQAANQSAEFTHVADLNWTRNVWEFTATGSRTTLEFLSLDSEGQVTTGPLLDNVRVRAIG